MGFLDFDYWGLVDSTILKRGLFVTIGGFYLKMLFLCSVNLYSEDRKLDEKILSKKLGKGDR